MVIAIQGMRDFMSDRRKGLEEIGVQLMVHSIQISYVRCPWNAIIYNFKTIYSREVRFSEQFLVREDARGL